MSPTEAQAHLEDYYAQLPAGYYPKKLAEVSSPAHTVRELKPYIYRVLSFIQHSLFYCILASGGVSEQKMATTLQLNAYKINLPREQFLRDLLVQSWKSLQNTLDLKGDCYIFMHALIDTFADLITSSSPFTLNGKKQMGTRF